jgi:hypothetical protein
VLLGSGDATASAHDADAGWLAERVVEIESTGGPAGSTSLSTSPFFFSSAKREGRSTEETTTDDEEDHRGCGST